MIAAQERGLIPRSAIGAPFVTGELQWKWDT